MFLISARTRRIKFWWHLLGAYIKKYRAKAFWIFLFVILVIFGLFKIWTSFSKSNTVDIGYVGNYTIEDVPAEVLSLATEPLITEGPDGKPQPALASGWTASNDGKTYVVFLKDNLTWHDSSPVDASDISIAISNVKITAVNNKTIQFDLPNPISSFLQALDKPVFKANTFYGTGEFRIVGIDSVNSIVKRISLRPKTPSLPRVEIKFYATEDQAKDALKMGEVKVLRVANAKEFNDWKNVSVKKGTDTSDLVTIFYNNNDQHLSSRDLRQALSYAINRDNFDGELANSPISVSSWAYDSTVRHYDYNISKAKELFAKTDAKASTITLSVMPGLDGAAKQIKENWEALGLKVEIKDEKSIPKNFQALLAVNHLSPDPDQYALWHSTQKDTNITGYVNVKIDKLLEDARTTGDESQRKALYSDFQKFLVEDVPATFLYNPYTYQIVYKNIQPLYDKLPKQN